jgi:hypothetical protein
MDVGTLLLMLGLSYPLGILWYELLPGCLPEQLWRVAAYPFLGIFVAQSVLPSIFPGDPAFGTTLQSEGGNAGRSGPIAAPHA